MPTRTKQASARPASSSRTKSKTPVPVEATKRASKTVSAHVEHAKPVGAAAAAENRSRLLEDVEAGGQGKYVYCIVRSDTPLQFGRIGIGAKPTEVKTINYKDIAAVVSDTPLQVYDATRENVLAHESVNEAVMKSHTVIPMSFATVFKTREDILELLRSAYDAFHDVLTKMEDKLEFGLKVLWESQEIVRQIEAEEEDIRRLKTELSSQKGSTYFARVQYDRLVTAALEARSDRYVRGIMDELRDVSVASRWNKPIGDKMILNAAFLVSRDKESVSDTKVKEIGARHSKLNFRYTGPWPPYNFVNIRLKLERAKDA